MNTKKLEYAIKVNIYTELKNEIQEDDCFDISYTICEFISNCLKNNYSPEYYVHSSKINEDIENELNTFCTFYLESEEVSTDELTNTFLKCIGDSIPKLDNNDILDETLNIQIQECFLSN